MIRQQTKSIFTTIFDLTKNRDLFICYNFMQQSELKYSQPELCGQNNTASRTGSVDSSLMCDKVQQYQRLLELGFQSLLQTQSVNQIRVIDFHTNQKKQISQPKSIMLQCVEYEKEQPALAYNQYTKSMNKSQKNKALNLSKKQKQQSYQSEQQTQSLRKSCSSSKTKTASIFKSKYDYQREEQLNFLKISQTKSQVVRKCDQFSDRFTDNFVNNQQFDLGQLSNGNFSLGFSCGFSNKPIGMNVQALQKAQKLFQFDQQVFKDKSQAVKKAQLLLNQNINHGKKQTKQQEFGSGMQEYLQQQKQGKKQGFHVQKFEISLSKQPIDNLIPTFSFAGGNKQISLNKKLQQKARRLLCINDEDEDEQGRQIQKDMKFLTNKKKKQQLTNLLQKNQKQTKKNLYQSINQPSLKNNYNLAPPNLQKKVHEQLLSESLPTVNNLAKLKSSKNLPTILNEGLKKHAYQNKQSKSKLKRKQIRSWQIVKSQIQLLIWQLKRPLESQKYIKTIKLNDLKNAAIDFEFYESENYKQFRHFTNSCKAYDCFYCELYVKEDRITKQEIIQRVIEKLQQNIFVFLLTF